MQPPPYQHTGSLPPHWQTRTDARGTLLYISPDGQTHTEPPTAISGPSVRDADGAISADLFGGETGAPSSYPTPMVAPGVGGPHSYAPLQPLQPLQPGSTATGVMRVTPAVQLPVNFGSSPGVPNSGDSHMSIGLDRDTAVVAPKERGGSVENASRQRLPSQATQPGFGASARTGLNQLMEMGYSYADANAALDQNATLEAAADWLAQGYKAMANAPLGNVSTTPSAGNIQLTPVPIDAPASRTDEVLCGHKIRRLQDMGYSRADAVAALEANGSDLQRAADWLMTGNTGSAPTPSVAGVDSLSASLTPGGAHATAERKRRTSVDEIEKFFGVWEADIGESAGNVGSAAVVAFDDEFDPRAGDAIPQAAPAIGNVAASTGEDAVDTTPTTAWWQWRCETGWKNYTDANNAILERGYSAYRANELGAVQREVDLENATHSVNFEEMKQFVKGQPWRKRDVRRQMASPSSYGGGPGQPEAIAMGRIGPGAPREALVASLERLIAEHNRVLADLRKRGPGHFAFLENQHEQQRLFARIQAQVAAVGKEYVHVHQHDDGSLVISILTPGSSGDTAAPAVGVAADVTPEPVPDVDLLGFFASEPTSTAVEPSSSLGVGQAGQSLARQDSEGTQKKLQMRHHAIKELLATEQRYGERLQLMDRGYFQPLSRRMPESDVRAMFSSFPAILQCQKKFYDDLAEAKERWEQQLGTSHSGGTTATSGVSGDGGIISVVERYTPFFKMYRPYVAGYPGALRKIEQLRADPSTASVLEGCKQQLGRGAPALEMLLIEPVQRIPRYRLLLEEARKHTPEEMHADCTALDKAIEAIGEVAENINENAREDDERRKVVEIHARFKPPKDDDLRAHGALASLVQPRRRFIQWVAVQAAELDTCGKGTQEEHRLKPRQLMLFNDRLMLVKDKGDDKLSYKAHIDFDDQVNFSEVRGSDWLTINGMGHYNDHFHGERPVHRMWKVKWETPGEMTQWEAEVQRYAKEVREQQES